jgi:SAM-dependent methyltransferase
LNDRAQSGARRIFSYNWPIFVATWIGAALVMAWAVRSGTQAACALALAACLWSLVSLAVSSYVYDYSELSAGRWALAMFDTPPETWCSIHAGLDAELTLEGVVPGTPIAWLDVYDAELMTSPSIARARATTPQARAAVRCKPQALPLAKASCDAVFVAFTAHEIRNQEAREQFFVEVRRALRPGGRMLLVEHVRDLWNFAAFGPGFLHFVARDEWLRLAAHAGLRVAKEVRITPWVMALALEKSHTGGDA